MQQCSCGANARKPLLCVVRDHVLTHLFHVQKLAVNFAPSADSRPNSDDGSFNDRSIRIRPTGSAGRHGNRRRLVSLTSIAPLGGETRQNYAAGRIQPHHGQGVATESVRGCHRPSQLAPIKRGDIAKVAREAWSSAGDERPGHHFEAQQMRN